MPGPVKPPPPGSVRRHNRLADQHHNGLGMLRPQGEPAKRVHGSSLFLRLQRKPKLSFPSRRKGFASAIAAAIWPPPKLEGKRYAQLHQLPPADVCKMFRRSASQGIHILSKPRPVYVCALRNYKQSLRTPFDGLVARNGSVHYLSWHVPILLCCVSTAFTVWLMPLS
jgi:hypothetical protein